MTLSGPKVQTHISTEIIAKRCNSLLIKIGTTLVSSFVSNTNRFNIDDASRDNIQEVIPMGSILMCNYAALCGGRMVFNIVVRGLSRRWKSLESEYVIIFSVILMCYEYRDTLFLTRVHTSHQETVLWGSSSTGANEAFFVHPR